MDIKGVFRQVIPFPTAKTEEAKAKAKLDAGNDKEGNGQSAGEEQKRRHLSPEEIQEAVQYLEGLPGVKENNLTIRKETKDGITVVYIEDRTGKIVRRIPESELAALTSNRDKKSGHLLNRAM